VFVKMLAVVALGFPASLAFTALCCVTMRKVRVRPFVPASPNPNPNPTPNPNPNPNPGAPLDSFTAINMLALDFDALSGGGQGTGMELALRGGDTEQVRGCVCVSPLSQTRALVGVSSLSVAVRTRGGQSRLRLAPETRGWAAQLSALLSLNKTSLSPTSQQALT
jgi:hypothetical protein